MTDLALAAPVRARSVAAWRAVPAGLVLGALTGVAARGWMRVVSSDPEFSWSGTAFIVGLFGVAGLLQGLALAVRRRGWRWWHQQPVRVLAAFGGLLLGSGAGIVMLPALVGGALAAARTDWSRRARAIPATVAGADALAMWWVLADGLPVWRLTAGWLTMLPVYAVVIGGLSRNLRPLAGGPHPPARTTRIVIAVVAALGAGFLGLSMVGI